MAIAGTYKVSTHAMGKDVEGDIVIEGEDTAFSGTATTGPISGTISEGVLTGESFTCRLAGEAPQPIGEVDLVVKGTLKDGHIKGSMKLGLFSIKFEGDRA